VRTHRRPYISFVSGVGVSLKKNFITGFEILKRSKSPSIRRRAGPGRDARRGWTWSVSLYVYVFVMAHEKVAASA
jgi:hypothetical protein